MIGVNLRPGISAVDTQGCVGVWRRWMDGAIPTVVQEYTNYVTRIRMRSAARDAPRPDDQETSVHSISHQKTQPTPRVLDLDS